MHATYILVDGVLSYGPYHTYTEVDDARASIYRERCENEGVPHIGPSGLHANMFNTKYHRARRIFEAIQIFELRPPQ